MKPETKSLKLRAISLLISFPLIISLTGCEAFVRKFTRKSKKENLPREEMVLAPEVYDSVQMSNEELYRQYFLFWKSWHDELINSLSFQGNRKKQIECVKESLKNLTSLRELLNEEKQKQLDVYIKELDTLKGSIEGDWYSNNFAANSYTAERLKTNILRNFSFKKISKDISYGE
ncbi:MAG: hypothetical protein A3K83_01935 [Omnitrophica WOR_2 bacterium RBG_13_44_8b]|nr:MAG: hypothetical protein A3K83_01935 [Omnitrophica WOR_2 bacterium RBG_13_44_8b]